MRIRTKRPVAPTPPPAAQVTTSGESRAPELKIRAFRIGFVGALVGVWLAAIEPRTERDLRALDGALGVRGWIAASLPLQGGALIGTGLATAALSLHEIEAAVVGQVRQL